MAQPPNDDPDRTMPGSTNDGSLLGDWLARNQDHELSGTRQEVTDRNGQIRSLGPSHKYRIGPVVGQGGQAAVAAAAPVGVPDRSPLVARVELNPRDPGKRRRRELLLFLAHLSRVSPATYPALIRVTESFVTPVPSSEIFGPPQFSSPQDDELVWVDVMERCGSLADHMRATHPNGYDPIEGAKLAVPLLRTLGVLHDNYRLVHRDIDEGNILVAPDGTLRIADWGVVVPMSGVKNYTYTPIFGKHHTLPPENRDGDQKVGHHTDAWQAGRLLGLILTGASPFLNDGITLDHPRYKKLPRELRTTIEGLTDPHTGARLGTYDAATLLEKYVGYPITTAPHPGSSNRRRALVAAAALTLTVAAVGTIALNWPPSSGSSETHGSPTPPSSPTAALVTNGTHEVIASPSGVVCDLSAARGEESAQWARCFVPHPDYPATRLAQEGIEDDRCSEALELYLPYPTEEALSCVPASEIPSAPILAAGSTNQVGQYACDVEEDAIQCRTSAWSSIGFAVSSSGFRRLDYQRLLSVLPTGSVRFDSPVWELTSDGANPITLPELARFYGFDPYSRRILHATNDSIQYEVGPNNLTGGDLVITDLGDEAMETVHPDNVVRALWSSNYEDIAYVVGTPTTYELWWHTAAGEERLLATGVNTAFSISPSDLTVAFTRHPAASSPDRPGLFIVSVEDGTETRLSDLKLDQEPLGLGEDQPVWSPDGRWVAVQDGEGTDYRISLARVDGTGATDLQLAPSLATEPWATTCLSELLWSPDGTERLIGESCSAQGREGHDLLVYQIDPENATLTSGQRVATIGRLIGWDVPGYSVWVYPSDFTTPERLTLE